MHSLNSIQEIPVADTLRLKGALRGVKDQRGKIARMLRAGDLTLLRRGLYAVRRDVNPMELAGAIYGPSYVSFETALSWHGLIPERVEAILSATLKRPSEFQNDFGTYRYRQIPSKVYPVGITMMKEATIPFLIASPTKAICDTIGRAGPMRSMVEVRRWLESMRIDTPLPLDASELRDCVEGYQRTSVRWLGQTAEKWGWIES